MVGGTVADEPSRSTIMPFVSLVIVLPERVAVIISVVKVPSRWVFVELAGYPSALKLAPETVP